MYRKGREDIQEILEEYKVLLNFALGIKSSFEEEKRIKTKTQVEFSCPRVFKFSCPGLLIFLSWSSSFLVLVF